MSRLFMQLLGDLVIEVNGQRCELGLHKSEALLIYVLLNGKKAQKEFVKELLYPSQFETFTPEKTETTPNQRQNFDDAIYRLRRGLREGLEDAKVDPSLAKQLVKQWIKTKDGQLDFSAISCEIDAVEFDQSTANLNATTVDELHKLEQAAALYGGNFLGGKLFKDVDAEFDTWISAKDNTLKERYDKLFLTLSIGYLACRNYEDAIERLESLLERDAEQFEAYGLLMICYSLIKNLTKNDDLVKSTYRRYEDASVDFENPPDSLMKSLRTALEQKLLKEELIHNVLENLIKENGNRLPSAEDILHALLIDLLRETTESYTFQQLIHYAELEAMNSGFRMLGTPHLFLALYAMAPPDFIDQLFTNLTKASIDVSPAQIVQRMQLILGEYPNQHGLPEGNVVHTLAVRQVRTAAHAWALEHGVKEVCLSHLWLALLEINDSLLAQILAYSGVNRVDLLEKGTNLILKGAIPCKPLN